MLLKMQHAIILNEGIIWVNFITFVTQIDGVLLHGLEMTIVIGNAMIINVI